MRKHYMTLCIRNNTKVTHIMRGNVLEVTFEEAVHRRSKTLVVMEDGTIVSNNGFNDSEVAFFLDFMRRNIEVMRDEALGLI